jgi:hypothetical protein
LSKSSRTSGLWTRPIDSKVRVKSTPESLKITIPHRFSLLGGAVYLILLLLCLMTTYILFLAIVLTQILSFSWFLLVIVLMLVLLGMGLLWFTINCFWEALLFLGGHIELLITESGISLKHQLFGVVRRQVLTAYRPDIYLLEMAEDRYERVEQGTLIMRKPAQINIWAGVKKFGFGENLTKLELEWLAQECSMWLNLPIARHRNS